MNNRIDVHIILHTASCPRHIGRSVRTHCSARATACGGDICRKHHVWVSAGSLERVALWLTIGIKSGTGGRCVPYACVFWRRCSAACSSPCPCAAQSEDVVVDDRSRAHSSNKPTYAPWHSVAGAGSALTRHTLRFVPATPASGQPPRRLCPGPPPMLPNPSSSPSPAACLHRGIG